MSKQSSRATAILRWIAALVAVLVFVRVLSSADLDRTRSLIARIGPAVLLIGTPYLLVIGFDALAWKWLLRILGRELRFSRLMAVRLSTEAVLLSFPGGALLAEGLKPVLLARDGVPYAETAATLAAKKVLLIGTQSLYLATAAIFGWNVLRTIAPALPVAVLLAALVLFAAATAMLLIFLHGSLGARSHRLLERLPFAGLRTWLGTRREGFAATDTHLASVFGAHVAELSRAAGPFFLSWLAESLESWTILHLLGVRLDFFQVMAFEAGVSLLRSIVFFVPAGLGVQDAGYMTALNALAIRDPTNTAAAFVLLKRAKEVFWIVTGYTVLYFVRRGPELSADVVSSEVRPNDD
ncbi:MAG: lysylphosphatidylglycerol synthase domain-containing protein [Polyangiales bacterium]